MTHIFISYSHKDSNYAHKLAKALEEAGFVAWIDERIDYGAEWPDVIEENLESCAAFVVIMSSNSRKSTWVKNELSHAQSLGKSIFPLLLEGARPWLSVASIQYVDVRDGKLPPQRFFDGIASILGAQAVATHKESSIREDTIVDVMPDTRLADDVRPVEWCFIPSGIVFLRDAKATGGTEGGKIDVSAFFMAKYPITNAQFDVFVNAADGFRAPSWWNYSDDAIKFHKSNPNPLDTAFLGDDLPRTNVSWYDAVAFCWWASSRLLIGKPSDSASLPLPSNKLRINLATEHQWQRAAIGDTGWLYPWGNDFNKHLSNTIESGRPYVTPVTQFLEGKSPYEVLDMSGNVWEWCVTKWVNGDQKLDGNGSRSLRGGSRRYSADNAQVYVRGRNRPTYHGNDIGFRCVYNI